MTFIGLTKQFCERRLTEARPDVVLTNIRDFHCFYEAFLGQQVDRGKTSQRNRGI